MHKLGKNGKNNIKNYGGNNMKKTWVIISIIAIIIVGIVVGIGIYNNGKNHNKQNNIIENNINLVSEKILDECTGEYEEIEKQAKTEIETNSNEEKISPNCLITLKRYYNECNHTINEYIDVPKELVNGTKEDIQKEYPNWEIQKYSSNEIIIYKEFDSNCGQHFILRDNDGKIVIYKINENNEEEEYERTEISVEYLTDTDKIEIQKGIRVNGIEELNQLIEDFE